MPEEIESPVGGLVTEVRNPESLLDFVPAVIDPEWVQGIAAKQRSTKLAEILWLLGGVEPQVNNIGYHERNSNVVSIQKGTRTAKRIFRGLQRPCVDDGVESSIFIYVLSPEFTYRYLPDAVCVMKRTDAPKDSVYAVYVRFNEGFTEATILDGEWVKAFPGTTMPRDYETRYEDSIWNG